MSIVTGLNGVMATQSTVRTFRVRETREAKPWSASGAAGMKSQIAGNKDWNGSASIYGYIPGTLPGSTFTFTGQTDSGSPGRKWTGSAIMDSLTVACNTEAADPLSCDIAFSANGDLSAATGAITDSGAPSIHSSISMGATWAGSALADVVAWNLTINSDNKPYVSSDTAGQTLRKAGNKSATASVTVLQSDASVVITPGTFAVLRLHVTGSLYWQLTQAVMKEWETNVDIEGGEINRVTYTFEYSGWYDNAGTQTQGSINKPDTTAYWP